MHKKYLLIFLCLFILSLNSYLTSAQIITTVVAGTSVNDGGPATNAALGGPSGIAFDHDGNLYISDSYEHTVRKIDKEGIISTIAGNGGFGYSGDGGLATNARLAAPRGIATDTAGNLYIADYNNTRIRKIDKNGVITTVAGNGQWSVNGDNGLATNAAISGPSDVVIQADGTIYLVASPSIRKVAPNGIITTVAGNGQYGFAGDNGPAINAQLNTSLGIAVDKANNLYVADTYNYRIRRIDTNGIITTIAGTGARETSGDGGPAYQAGLYLPEKLSFDEIGNLYFTQADHRIRKIDLNGTISTISGNGVADFTGDGLVATQATLNSPKGIRVDDKGSIYIADYGNYRIRQINQANVISTVAGGFTGDGGSALSAYLLSNHLTPTPSNITIDQSGNVYLTNRYSGQIRKVDANGIISTIAGTGVSGYSGDGQPAAQAKLDYPRGVSLDRFDNLFVVDQYNRYIRKIDHSGIITTVAGSGLGNFIENTPFLSSADVFNTSTLPIDGSGNMYVFSPCCVMKVAPSGTVTIVAGTTAGTGFSGDGGPATAARLNNPSSAAIDTVTNAIYISDGFNYRIRKIDASGIISTIAGNGNPGSGLNDENVQAINASVQPRAIAIDALGNLYFSETLNTNRVRKLDRNGFLSTITGNTLRGFSGDNGLAKQATLNTPLEIVLDKAGNIYIADAGNRRVRKITYPVQATLTASSPISCSVSSITLTAFPAGQGFNYHFGPGATQIGTTNKAVVTAAGSYSVTISTSVFGSPAGSATVDISDTGVHTIRAGNWNDPSIWQCGVVPKAGQRIQLLHPVNLPDNYEAKAGAVDYGVGGSLFLGEKALLRLSQ